MHKLARFLLFSLIVLMAGTPQRVHAELLTKDGLSKRESYLVRVQELARTLNGLDRSNSGTVGQQIYSLLVTLEAALRDLRFSEASERSGKVLPPGGISSTRGSNAGANSRALSEIPDDWLLQSVSEARHAVASLSESLDAGAELKSQHIADQIEEIVERVERISRPE